MLKRYLINLINKIFKKSQGPITLGGLLNKEGKLPIDEILKGKYPNIKINESPIGYRLSTISERTKTQTTFLVDKNGRLLKKENIIGEFNRISPLIHSNSTIYNGTIKEGKPAITPTVSYINYKLPAFAENGITEKYIKTTNGWSLSNRTPFSY